MATMNVSLPDPMREWVEAQARTGRYGSASDYVRELIRRDQDRTAAQARLQALIAEGFEGGVSDRSPAELLAEARRVAAGPGRRGAV